MSDYFLTIILLLTGLQLMAQADTLYGDLTADGIPEMLVTVRHPEPIVDTLEGYEVLETATVYRKVEGNWEAWLAAAGFLMHAYEEAGMARFYPRIERGALVLVHGSSGYVNLETTYRFRWQNGQFELIGYTYSQFERCERSELFDYNLSTGSWAYKEIHWTCDENWEPANETVLEDRKGVLQPGQTHMLPDSGYLDFAPPGH